MKTIILALALLAAGSVFVPAAQPSTPATPGQTGVPAPTAYAIVANDNNSRVWERTEYEQAAGGTVVARQHRYTELATGLNYQDPQTGQWQPSQEAIDILPNGGAATNGAHQVYFPGDIAQGVIRMVTPDGLQLQSRPVSLFYVDDTNSVVIAILTNSVGELVSSNTAVYPNAFEGANASIRYTYSKAGFEQDVIVQGQLPDPAALGLDPARTRLGVLTLFFDTNNPVATAGPIDPVDGLSDTTLAFGQTEMSQGRAFSIGDTAPSTAGATPGSWLNWATNAAQHSTVGGTHTYKRWVQVNGRNYLMEEVPYPRVAPQLQQLPPATGRLNTAGTNLYAAAAFLEAIPARLLASGAPAKMPAMRLSRVDWNKTPALVLDYVTVTTGGNYLFQGDTTYYVSGPCYFGNVTLEGGTVIKYENMSYLSPISIGSAGDTATAFISVSGTLACNTSIYRPAIFTAADDNTVGDTISGSTGSPSGNFYANPAIYAGSYSNIKLSNARIRYAEQGVWVGDYGSITLSDSQVIACQCMAVLGWGDGYGYTMTLTCNNCLYNGPYYGSLVVDDGVGGDSYNLTNCTFNNLYYLIVAASTYSPNTVNAVNSIFANSSMTAEGYYSLQGSHNGFYSTGYTFGSSITSTGSSPFQTVGAGSFYLATTNFRGIGTASIGSGLLADLRTKTTYPPVVYFIPGVYFSTNLSLSPICQRDTNTVPDLGYHYDPLDYVFGPVYVTNATITVNPGTAIGIFGTNIYTYGFAMANNSVFQSQGAPNNLVRLVAYNTVQEQTPSGWEEPSYGLVTHFSGTQPVVSAGFTDWSGMAQDGYYLRMIGGTGPFNFQNCQFHGGLVKTSSPALNFTNCLFERVNCDIEPQDTNVPVFINNTVYGGTFGYGPWTATNAVVQNNLFDHAAIPDWLGAWDQPYVGGHNAYVTNCDKLDPTFPGDIVLTNSPVYQTSWFGNYYLPTSSPLIDAGSTTADQVGLYHFTTQTNQVPETNSVVDIGYHYVATDAYGNPLDTDGDGVPDYLEDANGDGVFDTGDLSDWLLSPYNGLTHANGLSVFTPLK